MKHNLFAFVEILKNKHLYGKYHETEHNRLIYYTARTYERLMALFALIMRLNRCIRSICTAIENARMKTRKKNAKII